MVGVRMTKEEIIATVGGGPEFSELDLATALEVAAYLDARKSQRASAAPTSSLPGGSPKAPVNDSTEDADSGFEPEDLEQVAATLKASLAEFDEQIAEALKTLRELAGLPEETETLSRAS